MASSDIVTPALQTYSIMAATLAATLAAGTNLATTVVFLPVLRPSSQANLATQWQTLFDSGITPVVTLAMTSATGFAILAYRATSTIDAATGAVSHAKRNLYIGAAVMAFSLGPFTQIMLGATNAELSRRAKLGGKEGFKGTHELVERWGRLNLARGCLVLVGAGLGLWASVDRLHSTLLIWRF
ncbi:hypothetical protein K504DRAFT_538639 [Pleomassaria siparia CBS 279.74]|uniref:DUF1772-domain-containing protein n=1 Tax=Pleomassaria siparia CBS 279.74 TaxID=1314801 RepID=A0A6G1JU36_9PLEO|nr:hypothetical protein K504DRAFT_538639 [Pleomassaria siparia CBS 279.74]